MDTLFLLLQAVAVISMAAMGGIYFVFSAFVMQALAAVPAGAHAMTEINRVIVRSLFVPLFVLSSLLALFLLLHGLLIPFSPALFSGSLIYLVGMLLCTGLFNVPLNHQLEQRLEHDPDRHFWAHYCRRWTRWNHLRTISSLLAAMLIYSA